MPAGLAPLSEDVIARLFAQVPGEIGRVHDAAEREATLTGDLYLDLARYGPAATAPARQTRLVGTMLADIREPAALRDTRTPTFVDLPLTGALAGFSGPIIHLITGFVGRYSSFGRAAPSGLERILASATHAADEGDRRGAPLDAPAPIP